jgi:hypothetical protein
MVASGLRYRWPRAETSGAWLMPRPRTKRPNQPSASVAAAPEFEPWTLVDVVWTSKRQRSVSADNRRPN